MGDAIAYGEFSNYRNIHFPAVFGRKRFLTCKLDDPERCKMSKIEEGGRGWLMAIKGALIS